MAYRRVSKVSDASIYCIGMYELGIKTQYAFANDDTIKNLDIFPVGIRQTKMTSTKKQKKKLFEI